MKRSLLKLLAVVLFAGVVSACSEEEINPQEELNDQANKTHGVMKDDDGF